MIDLQLHSCFSDGSDTPTELVQQAKKLGLTAIALTDHDTIDGLPEFIEAGIKYNIKTVTGVEISVDTRLPNNGHMHIIGLFIDPKHEPLKHHLDFLRTERNKRAKKIVDKLTELGHKITLDELYAEAGEGSIGRPHVAKILLRRKVVSQFRNSEDIIQVYNTLLRHPIFHTKWHFNRDATNSAGNHANSNRGSHPVCDIP